MSPALTNLTAHAESMTVIALILVGAAVKAIRHLFKRRFPSHLTLQTDSFDLHLQTKQLSSQQELLQLEQPGDDENDRSTNDNGRIPSTNQRPKL